MVLDYIRGGVNYIKEAVDCGGSMNKTGIIIITLIAFCLAGGLIILWSVHEKKGAA